MTLSSQALDQGFTTETRQVAWAQLLGLEADVQQPDNNWTQMPVHPEEEQVRLDVDRAFNLYPSGLQASELDTLREDLQNLICSVLRRHPYLSYYQGYHDVASVVLLVYRQDPTMGSRVLEKFTLHYLRDFMLPAMDSTLQQLYFIPELLSVVEPGMMMTTTTTTTRKTAVLEKQPQKQGNTGKLEKPSPLSQPFYALSSVLTIFAHHVQSFDQICRIYDCVLVAGMTYPIYLYVATAVYMYRTDQQQFAADPDELYLLMSTCVEQIEDFEPVVRLANSLQTLYPLDQAFPKVWQLLSEYSVMRTGPQVDQPVEQLAADQVKENKTMVRPEPMSEHDPPQTTDNGSWLLIGLSIGIGLLGVVLYYRDAL